MIKSTLFSLLGVGAISFLICDLCRPTAEAATTSPLIVPAERAHVAAPVADAEEVTLEIEGMTCGGCALAARTVLTRLPGVEKAEVSYRERAP